MKENPYRYMYKKRMRSILTSFFFTIKECMITPMNRCLQH